MMILVRALIILLLAGAIFGGSAYFAYELYWKPQQLDREDKRMQAEAPPPTPPPDYSIAVFDKTVQSLKTSTPEEGRKALADFIAQNPASPKIGDAKRLLGDMNVTDLFTPSTAGGKVPYTVGRGDALAKVASKMKTNADLIYRVNNLETINLSIGQQLYIPQLATTIAVDRKAKTLTVLNNGAFFKEYPLVSAKGTTVGNNKVADKIALNGTTRVAFGDKNYAGADRWLMLGGGVAIRGGDAAAENHPPGFIVPTGDMEEIFLLVSRGTPVTIQ